MREDHNEAIDPKIEHHVDEIWIADTLEQRYNYLDYHFEQRGAYLRARAYLDNMFEVTLFGPFAERGSIDKIKAEEAEAEALTYLQSRYLVVQRL